ncbi:MAG: hypothetical protein A2622_08815 [Bdellovibrionales bacterium RIFCSPHIGHO2_01_FULL_40_29]|nr:MAG: hypothetical protein A2622_08815 [Bdellovibrionales bacterium RIFCSPHIGHO2_01_FULL_40_29]OFZ32842.1 MAG: hypothetical protein A3D17_09025 [Bdellovibrionales bacterium RIFCSPHIGHO2_02_FULL_40_15]
MKSLIMILISAVLTAQAHAQQKRPPARKMVVPTYQAPMTSSWASFTHELDVNLSSGEFRSYKVGTRSVSNFGIFATYSYDLMPAIQVGADVGFQSLDSESAFTLAATGTYNFDSDYSDAFFVKAGLGLYPFTTTTTKSEFGFYAGAGKRFKIWEHVNYKPGLFIRKISDGEAEFIIQFFNISLNTGSF